MIISKHVYGRFVVTVTAEHDTISGLGECDCVTGYELRCGRLVAYGYVVRAFADGTLIGHASSWGHIGPALAADVHCFDLEPTIYAAICDAKSTLLGFRGAFTQLH